MYILGFRFVMLVIVVDVYYLLCQSLIKFDLVVFIEYKVFYICKEEVDFDVELFVWGKVVVCCIGFDFVIVIYLCQVIYVFEVVEQLVKKNIDVMVIDLCIFNLFDFDIVCEYVEWVGKVMVVSEGVMMVGVVVEFCVCILEECFDYFEQFVICVVGEDILIFVLQEFESGSVLFVCLIVEIVERMLL